MTDRLDWNSIELSTYLSAELTGISIRAQLTPRHTDIGVSWCGVIVIRQPRNHPMRRGKPARLEFEYERKGTRNIFAAFNIRNGHVLLWVTPDRTTPMVLSFLDHIVRFYRRGPLVIITDNISTRTGDAAAEWLRKHSRVRFVFTPKHGSWLNQVEIWFGILTRSALRHRSFASVAELGSAIAQMSDVGRVNAAVLADRAARGTAAHRDLLGGCELGRAYSCRLRLADTVTTCNGCHTLDRRGNEEFGVYRPGFFGTSGKYSFEAESQIFKIPHLRNAYAKAGMFGVSSNAFLAPSSSLGDRRGGLLSPDALFMGAQIRGFGYLHDGGVDTLHHFFGSAPFGARPPGTVSPYDPGNASAFQTFLPAAADRAACIAEFRAISDAQFAEMPPALALCRDGSGVPDACFANPAATECTSALEALALERGEPALPGAFLRDVRPNCFRMGSMLQGGADSGSCFPEGLRERTDMEAFVLAFDSNLAPMVGQQLTLNAGRPEPGGLLSAMLRVAARGGCDISARQGARGYLVVEPNDADPDRTFMPAGQGLGLIHDVQPAEDIFRKLVDETAAAIGRMKPLV